MRRLDQELVVQGFFSSRERAQGAIMAGQVLVDGKPVDKPGYRVAPDSQIEVRGNDIPYVSRGGLKLDRALEQFHITVEGRICLDIGASTGGFTDCLLKNGAAKVFAVDVGYGQLDWSLRCDPRVVVMERTNARYLRPEQLGETPDFCCIDVSFISLRLILPAVCGLLAEEAELVTLIKPQFEAGRDKVGKKGVVRSAEIHTEVIAGSMQAGMELGLACAGLTYSPIKGPEGNIEFLAYWRRGGEPVVPVPDPAEVVKEAHQKLQS